MRALITFLVAVSLLSAADKFSGKWSSSENGADGTIQIQVSAPTATFTLGGEEVKTKVLSMRKEDAKIELRYEFDFRRDKTDLNARRNPDRR
jgi:hypothetical protein